jgi:hypothetical protein
MTTPGRRILAQLQEEAWHRALQVRADHAMTLGQQAADALSRYFTVHDMVKWRERFAPLLSRQLSGGALAAYESPWDHSILGIRRSQIEAAAKTLQLTVPPGLIFGTLMDGRINAFATQVRESGEFIVVFNQATIAFLSLFAKSIAAGIPRDVNEDTLRMRLSRDRVHAQLNQRPEIIARFVELILACVVHGDPRTASSYLLSGVDLELYPPLLASMELFVLGHEYGHITKDHWNGPRAKKHPHPEVDECLVLWNKEFEADSRGLELSARASSMQGIDTAIAFACGELVLRGIECLGNAAYILQHGTEAPAPVEGYTHPPPVHRRQVLRLALQKSMGTRAEGPISTADRFGLVADHLWERSRPVLLELHQAGVRPRPISW